MPRLVRDGEETTTTAASTLAAPPANTTQPSCCVQESNNEKQNQLQMQLQKQKLVTANNKPKEKVVIPPPPPGVPEIQLRIWEATLRRRMQQLKQLSSEHLSGFANEIREDFITPRHGTNEYSAALALVNGRKSKESNGGSGGVDSIDLAEGWYSSLFLQQEISPESIGRHFLALFYRSIDNRLPPAMSKHGLDTLRRACASLDEWRKKWEQEKSRKRKRSVGGEYDNNMIDDVTRNAENIGKGREQIMLRKDSIEPASKRANVTTKPPHRPQGKTAAVAPNDQQLDQQEGGIVAVAGTGTSSRADVDMKDPTSLFQTALGRGFSEFFLRDKTEVELQALLSSTDKTIHDTSSSKAKGTTENINSTGTDQSLPLHASASKDDSPIDDSPAAMSNITSEKKSVQTEVREDLPKKDSKMAGGNSYSTQPAKPHESAQLEGGAPSNHQAGDSDSKKMTGASSQAKVMEGNAKTFSSSDAARPPEVRVSSTNTEDTSTAVDHSPALKSCDNDKIDTANDSPSNVPAAGYRRRTVRKCPIDDCPNKGGKCTLHGALAKICTIEGCDNFLIQGFDVCIKHGATRPDRRESNGTANDSPSNAPVSNDSPSNVPAAGYRRRTVRKCHIDDCRNKGGKCTLHGPLAKICTIEGCDNFQIQGFDVCIKHGATRPNQCKAIGCTKQKVVGKGYCTNHLQEFSSTTQHSESRAEPQLATANKSQASSAYAPAEPQLSARNELQAASAIVPTEIMSLKRESYNGLQCSNAPNDEQAETPAGAGNRANTQQNNDDDELIDLTADSPVKEAPPEQLISPPPSPPPTTIIRNPPPPAKSRPLPFSEFQKLLFCADTVTERGTTSGCVKDYAHQEMVVEFDRGFHLDGSGGSLDNAQCIDVRKRLSTWDPYWKIVEELGHRDVRCGHGDSMTSVGTRTTACLPVTKVGNSVSIPSCALVSIDFRQEISRSTSANRDERGRSVQGFRPWGVKWGKAAQPDRHQQGERRLIMRCVPLRRTATDEKKRADLHLWPLGSFVQIKLGQGRDLVVPVVQRKQQSHDHSKWLGNSRHLDLTRYIPDTNNPLEIKICSKEVIEGVVDGGEGLKNSYAVHVAVCEYTEPDVLYNQLMGKVEGGEVVMPKLSLRSAKRMLKECIANNTITLDSDEEEGDGNSESDFLTFSLLCHASKKCIETPVRGQHCTHLQCFDLRNYLNTNNVVSAGRWRCPCCEKFVSVRDLVHCGLFQEILDDLGDKIIPGVRDNVCVKADGTWQLLGENKLRYRKSGTKSEADSSASMDVEVIESEGEEPEVIDLL